MTKGNKVCEMNPIPQANLEAAVVEAVLEFYKPYLARNGRPKLTQTIREQMGSEHEDFAKAKKRAEAEQQRLTRIINNLLDNITPTNREFVDGRLKELTEQRQQLEARLEELDRLTTTQAEIQTIVTDAVRFLSSLEFTLRQGLPQEKLTALRQCITRVHINKPAGEIRLTVRTIPTGNLDATHELTVALATPTALTGT